MSYKAHEAVCLDSMRRYFFFYDHFLGDSLRDLWRSTGDAGGSAVVIDQQAGGIVRITTDVDDTDKWEIDWSDIRSLLVSKKASIEIRVKVNQTANTYIYLRIHNANADYIEWHRYLDENWVMRCRAANVNSDADSGIALDTDYHIFRIECHTQGGNHVHFYIDDNEYTGSPISTNITALYLQPWLRAYTTGGAISMDVDYCAVRQER